MWIDPDFTMSELELTKMASELERFFDGRSDYWDPK